jgi:hypothetical protein
MILDQALKTKPVRLGCRVKNAVRHRPNLLSHPLLQNDRHVRLVGIVLPGARLGLPARQLLMLLNHQKMSSIALSEANGHRVDLKEKSLMLSLRRG